MIEKRKSYSISTAGHLSPLSDNWVITGETEETARESYVPCKKCNIIW